MSDIKGEPNFFEASGVPLDREARLNARRYHRDVLHGDSPTPEHPTAIEQSLNNHHKSDHDLGNDPGPRAIPRPESRNWTKPSRRRPGRR